MKKYLQKLYRNLHLSITPICVIIIASFWIYLLLQIEFRNTMWLLISNTNPITLMISLIIIGILYLIKKLKEFKQELFDEIERKNRNTIAYLLSKLS